MKSLAGIAFLATLVCGCGNDNITPAGTSSESSTLHASSALLLPQQIEGHVRFANGDPAPSGTLVTAYLNYVEKGHEQTESTGDYGISGNNPDFPTGTYDVITEVVHKGNKDYMGGIDVYHIQDTPTQGQDITLLLLESRAPQR